MSLIVVLTLGRSGSSLLMQSLGLLGVSVIGRKFDQHDDPSSAKLHHQLNPGGYFEEPDIYYGGPRSEAFHNHLHARSVRRACKMDLRHLSDPLQVDAWLAAAPKISTVLVSFRNPSEQAKSEFIASGQDQSHSDNRTRFMFITSFLQDYCANYGAVPKLAHSPLSVLAGKTSLVDFAEIASPRSYVERIVQLASLDPTQAEFDRAIANIDSDLLRIRANDLDRQERDWASDIGADEVFNQLVQSRKRDPR